MPLFPDTLDRACCVPVIRPPEPGLGKKDLVSILKAFIMSLLAGLLPRGPCGCHPLRWSSLARPIYRGRNRSSRDLAVASRFHREAVTVMNLLKSRPACPAVSGLLRGSVPSLAVPLYRKYQNQPCENHLESCPKAHLGLLPAGTTRWDLGGTFAGSEVRGPRLHAFLPTHRRSGGLRGLWSHSGQIPSPLLAQKPWQVIDGLCASVSSAVK